MLMLFQPVSRVSEAWGGFLRHATWERTATAASQTRQHGKRPFCWPRVKAEVNKYVETGDPSGVVSMQSSESACFIQQARMVDFRLTSWCWLKSGTMEEIYYQWLAHTWPPFVANALVVTNVIDADGTLRPLLHFASFMLPPGRLCASAEPSCGIFPQHHDRLAHSHVILKHSQRTKPSQDGRAVSVVLVWEIHGVFLWELKWVSPFLYTLD